MRQVGTRRVRAAGAQEENASSFPACVSLADSDTLANMIVCMQHLDKPPEQMARYTNQLRAVAPSHPWVVRYNELDASFDRCAAQFNTGVHADVVA